uniref:DMT family transporter n=1 Tax=Tessaracoccus timonensis TaxID=2161816 RepID=UPI000D5525EB|nr:multidrug efflux SMR transporter [Tessaracoccus timonensis]
MNKWFLLAGAIVCEVVSSLSLKAALSQPLLYIVVVLGYSAAFLFLAMVLRRGMPLGVAYGIWGAMGVAATAVLSYFIFHEPLTGMMGVGLTLVIAGVLVVDLGSHHAGGAEAQQDGAA